MTKIEWCEESWNPVTGCDKISEGCAHCYAERMSKRLRGRYGYPAKNPFQVTLHLDRLDQPLKWRKPRMIFVCSMGDLFHKDVPDSYIDRVLARAYACPQHKFLILTKRPERMAVFFCNNLEVARRVWSIEDQIRNLSGIVHKHTWPLPNLWLGVTAENQKRFDERWAILKQIPAAIRFISAEPLLSRINIEKALPAVCHVHHSRTCCKMSRKETTLDWCIAGGESGPGARPMHPDWARQLRDQCSAAGVPFFFKQYGEWIPRFELKKRLQKNEIIDPRVKWGVLNRSGQFFEQTTLWNGREGDKQDDYEHIMFRVGKKAAGRLLDGKEWSQNPKV